MATTTLPPVPASAPPPPSAAGPGNRFVSIHADLMPQEIIAKRRLRQLKRRLGISLIALVGLLVAWYAFALLQTSQARSDRTSAEHRSQTLRAQQLQFGPLVTAQAQSAAIKAELAKLMAGDVQWKSMLATLRASATRGVTLSGVSASMLTGAASPSSAGAQGGLAVLNQTGKQQIGTLTITGGAPDKNSVAAYVDTLAKVKGLAAPYPANVTGQNGKLQFTVNVIITSDALGGRYSATSQGGH
jgi:Tfp pilus assembly protein PilN